MDQDRRTDTTAGPEVYAPYGPLYLYCVLSLFCKYLHIGRSLVVADQDLDGGIAKAREVRLIDALMRMITGMHVTM